MNTIITSVIINPIIGHLYSPKKGFVRSFLFTSIYFYSINHYIFLYFNNNEFDTTDTELNAIAPPAIIGLRSHPVNG